MNRVVVCLFLLLGAITSHAQSPSATCTDGLVAQSLQLGDGLALPKSYSNPTSRQVEFTTIMRANRFFGPERVVGRLTLPAGTGRTSSVAPVIQTSPTTPMGTGRVTIDVVTDRPADGVVGSCSYHLKLVSPPPMLVQHPLFNVKMPSPLIQIPVRMCAMRGTVLSSQEQANGTIQGSALMDLLSRVNNDIWHPQAQIAFSSAVDRDFPLIDDPQSIVNCSGPASVSVGQSQGGEAEAASRLCQEAWDTKYPGRVGQSVVFVRSTCPNGPGVARGAPNNLKIGAPRGDDLCRVPRRISHEDFADADRFMFSVLLEPGPVGGTAAVAAAFAHELGHNLFLGHGDGVDNDSDSAPVGLDGARFVDTYCDQDEGQGAPNGACGEGTSLMSTPNNSCGFLSRYQIELARTSAIKSLGAKVGQNGLSQLFELSEGPPVVDQ